MKSDPVEEFIDLVETSIDFVVSHIKEQVFIVAET